MKISKLGSSILLCMALASSLTSCATVVNGTHQSIGISSNPTNAHLWVDSRYVGRTPMIVQLSRKDNHTVTISLEGFETYQVVFSRKVSGWVFGNIIFGGVIGLAVDAISGGIYALTPDQVHAELCYNSMLCCKKVSTDSYVTVVLSPDPSWKKIGNLTAKAL